MASPFDFRMTKPTSQSEVDKLAPIDAANDPQDYRAFQEECYASPRQIHRLLHNEDATESSKLWHDPIIEAQQHLAPASQHPITWNGADFEDDYFPIPTNTLFGTYLENVPIGFENIRSGYIDSCTSLVEPLQQNANPLYPNSWQFEPNVPTPIPAQNYAAGLLPVTMASASISPQPSPRQRLFCPQGCEETFRGPGEYRRHMKKHEDHPFKCPVAKCDKTFSRPDKWFDHVEKGHKRDRNVARFCASIMNKQQRGNGRKQG